MRLGYRLFFPHSSPLTVITKSVSAIAKSSLPVFNIKKISVYPLFPRSSAFPI